MTLTHPATIIEIVSRVTEVSIDVLLSKDRHMHIAKARFAAYYVLRAHKFSFPVIGTCLGGRDHTTAIAGYHKAVELYEVDTDFKLLIQTIELAIQRRKDTVMAAPASFEEFTKRCAERLETIRVNKDEGVYAQRYLEDVTILLKLIQSRNETPEDLYQRAV
jgi:hypothetical protein